LLPPCFPYTTLFRSLVLAERSQIAVTFFGGDFVAYVEKLTEVRIEVFVFRIVAQGGGKLFGRPTRDLLRRWETIRTNVDDRGVRSEEHTSELQSREN